MSTCWNCLSFPAHLRKVAWHWGASGGIVLGDMHCSENSMNRAHYISLLISLLVLPSCAPGPGNAAKMRYICNSRLEGESDRCADEALAALQRIVAGREKRFERRDDCSAISSRSESVGISFFSQVLRPLEYPPEKRSGGVARLRMHVDASGLLQSVEVVQSSGDPAQDAVAIEHAWGWCYVPAQRAGKDVGGTVEETFPFDIEAP
ncbi:energy transducer TonB family protein [Stenotrophomonas maltophilia]|uniref:energy transducer TonB family protein n=1 Tax=Stenotrophomonas maltophilia TaxID=40324 RepID=UPI00240CF872|nr:TonB family protein [Stenotrophomonas maltophilia]MDG2508256.1 TonB family protein [Stenotrophomonas maltophilia]